MSIRFAVSVVLATTSITASDVASAADSASTLSNVVVTATRTPTPIEDVLANVTIIGREEIARSLSTDVAELLRMHAGIEVARNGGPGQTTSVFIRGANSTQTLILLDGVRINPGTIATASLQNIPPETIDHIEIVKGPRSTLYGSDAIGGVINIVTRKQRQDGVDAEAQVGDGSFNTRHANALINITGSAGTTGANISWIDSDGFPTKQATNIASAYDNLTMGAHASTTAGAVELGARIYQATGTAAYSDYFLAPIDQDFTDRVVRFDAASQLNTLWKTQLVLSRLDNSVEQNQPISFPAGEMDFLKTLRTTVDWQNDLALAAAHQLTAGIMYAREDATSRSYGSYFDQETTITNAYIQHQFTEAAHSLLLALGYTDYSTFGDDVTWNAEYGYRFSNDTQIVGSAGSAFRAPSATDLFGSGGNPNLSAENALSYELSLRHPITAKQSISLTAFQNEIDDLITYDPVSQASRNIERARIRGVEARYDIRGDKWHANFDATYQDPINLDTGQVLPRRAKETASAAYAHTIGIVELGANVLYSGERIDTQYPGAATLAAYWLTNLNARIALGKQWSVMVQIDNVFDEQYELADGYNTADRGGYLAVRWNLR